MALGRGDREKLCGCRDSFRIVCGMDCFGCRGAVLIIVGVPDAVFVISAVPDCSGNGFAYGEGVTAFDVLNAF